MLHFTHGFMGNLPPLMGTINTSHWKAEKSTNRPIQRVEKKEQLQGCLPFDILLYLLGIYIVIIVLYIKYCLVLSLKIGKVYIVISLRIPQRTCSMKATELSRCHDGSMAQVSLT